MRSFLSLPLSALLAVSFSFTALAQTETVHAVIALVRHGERTPIALGNSTLTPLGAQQMYTIGQGFRNRFIAPPSGTVPGSAINGIQTYRIDNMQISALSLLEDYVVSSTQSFFQGLYPPTNQTSSDLILNGVDIVANGSIIQSPLGGYQYPQIETFAPYDPNRIFLDGSTGCDNYGQVAVDYFSTAEATNNLVSTQIFYNRIKSAVFPRGSPLQVDYANAYRVYDYVNYEYVHNKNVSNSISADDLSLLQRYASAQQWGLLGNVSASAKQGDRILTVPGQTFANIVMDLFGSVIGTNGIVNKFSALMAFKDPMMSFAALAQLPSVDPDFRGLPNYGANMVFELFSVGNNTAQFPSTRDLMVRFLFQNGTNSTTGLRSYPLFGRPRSQTDMTWNDFAAGMRSIMLPSIGSWCSACNSSVYYCPIFDPTNRQYRTIVRQQKSSGMKPAVAGVIGAIVTLAVIGLAITAAMLLGGIRLRRKTKQRPRSDLSGFKGTEKLASDADLTSGRVVDPATGRGHERIGSWELKDAEQREAQSSTLDGLKFPEGAHHADRDVDDRVNPFGDPVKPREHV